MIFPPYKSYLLCTPAREVQTTIPSAGKLQKLPLAPPMATAPTGTSSPSSPIAIGESSRASTASAPLSRFFCFRLLRRRFPGVDRTEAFPVWFSSQATAKWRSSPRSSRWNPTRDASAYRSPERRRSRSQVPMNRWRSCVSVASLFVRACFVFSSFFVLSRVRSCPRLNAAPS